MKTITIILSVIFWSFGSLAQVTPGLHIEKGMVVLFGEETTGNGVKTFWIPAKAAFRSGCVGSCLGTFSDETAWDPDSIGLFSFASGVGSIAKGRESVSMGHKTRALRDQSIALGISTLASGIQSVALGSVSEATNTYSTAMGRATKASGYGSTAMGSGTEASGSYSTAIGSGSDAIGNHAIAMGRANEASGNYSLATGVNTIASGDTSTVMGYGVNTNGQAGAFMIGDADPHGEGTTNSAEPNQMIARFWNGYFFLTSGNDVRTGVKAPHGAIAWSSTCDINKKENFLKLDDEEILEKLASIEFYSWNLKGQSPSKFRHYGITAQDFFHLFGQDDYGTIGCDTLVNPIDMMGIAMSAIKGLKIYTDQLKEINVELQIEQDHQQSQFDILFQENEILKEKINKLEEQMALFLKQREVNDVKGPTGP